MEEKVLIAKYGEVAMRGNNFAMFISQLVATIRKNLREEGEFYVVKEQGRLVIESRGGEMDYDRLIPKVEPIFGLVGLCPGVKTIDQSIETLCQVSLHHMQELFPTEKISFKVVAKRANKKYPLTSQEVATEVGGYLLERMPNLSVDVHHPDIILRVELRNDAYVYSKVIPTFGGLPMGSSGKAISLLSGGIDSPVATWMMAKRGVAVEGVYFHSPPYTSEWAKQKVEDLAERLSCFTGEFRLHVVPFTEVQLYLLDHVPHDKLTIFLKRAMMRTAQKIAEREKALALITGDSVGQVSSQTLQGLHAINAAVGGIPVLRPLAGMDKQEIVDMARKIGTFDISIRPYEDCCTIFVAKHPETRPKTSVIERIESRLTELDALLEKALEEAECIVKG
ncbi:MAG: tRNA 4-thiouridine(8) synthase ThiI [Epulopiscium sp.]|jgi:thiamine biosynthesis protein ThiI|nr:tRNA 4-thiouridine(8) synthase ThiI [Candidatus Epulonipiscium sp.]